MLLTEGYYSSFETFWGATKAEIPQVGTFFRTQFPSLGIFINKKQLFHLKLVWWEFGSIKVANLSI